MKRRYVFLMMFKGYFVIIDDLPFLTSQESLSQQRWTINDELITLGTLKHMLLLLLKLVFWSLLFACLATNYSNYLLWRILGNTDQTFYTFWITHKQRSLTHLFSFLFRIEVATTYLLCLALRNEDCKRSWQICMTFVTDRLQNKGTLLIAWRQGVVCCQKL